MIERILIEWGKTVYYKIFIIFIQVFTDFFVFTSVNKLFERFKLLFSVKTVGVFILTISLFQQPVTAETLTVSDLSLSRLFDFAYGLIGDYESLNHRSDDIVNINNQTDKLIVLGVNFKQSYSDNDVSIFTDTIDEMSSDDVEAAVIGTPLVYPNPFKFSTDSGGILAYTLSKDMEMEIQIYNMLAQRIFKNFF